jgi:hypothetical protein
MNRFLALIACLAIFVSGCSFLADVSRAVGGMHMAIADALDKEGEKKKAAKKAK